VCRGREVGYDFWSLTYELVVRRNGAASGLDRSGDLAGGFVEGGEVRQRGSCLLFTTGSGEAVGSRGGLLGEG
jgi:hypothetical protein